MTSVPAWSAAAAARPERFDGGAARADGPFDAAWQRAVERAALASWFPAWQAPEISTLASPARARAVSAARGAATAAPGPGAREDGAASARREGPDAATGRSSPPDLGADRTAGLADATAARTEPAVTPHAGSSEPVPANPRSTTPAGLEPTVVGPSLHSLGTVAQVPGAASATRPPRSSAPGPVGASPQPVATLPTTDLPLAATPPRSILPTAAVPVAGPLHLSPDHAVDAPVEPRARTGSHATLRAAAEAATAAPPIRVHVERERRLADVWIGADAAVLDDLPAIVEGIRASLRRLGLQPRRIVCNGADRAPASTRKEHP